MSKLTKARANLQFTAGVRKEQQFQSELEKERQAKLDRTAKLRALRLAKEAADREAAKQGTAGLARKRRKSAS